MTNETAFGTLKGRAKPEYDAPNLNPDNAEFLLCYDVETQGLPLWHEPSDDPRQPHLVQVAAALVHMPTRQIVDSMNVIVKPDGWEIPDEVAAIHGITQAIALERGIPEADAVAQLVALWRRAEGKFGHNESFDRRLVRIALKRFVGAEIADEWKAASFNCTCFLATPIMNMAPTERMKAAGFGGKPKKPKLTEAHQFFVGRPLDGAHDAMNDVHGCLAVYFAIQDGITTDQTPAPLPV
jgi:DNA polymerase-3 subunit epsilon